MVLFSLFRNLSRGEDEQRSVRTFTLKSMLRIVGEVDESEHDRYKYNCMLWHDL